MNMDAINAAIAAAKENAANAMPAAVPAVGVGGGSVAVAPLPVGGRPVSLSEMLAEVSANVDGYLKVSHFGFSVDEDKSLFEEIEVEFSLADVKVYYGLRWGQQPAKYLKSFDRIVESKSKKPWAQCIAEAQAADSRCKGDYPGSEVPLKLVNDLVGNKGDKNGKVILEAGQVLGFTASITAAREFLGFIKPFNDAADMGAIPRNVILRGKIVHAPKEKGSEKWGIPLWKDFVAVGLGDQAEAA